MVWPNEQVFCVWQPEHATCVCAGGRESWPARRNRVGRLQCWPILSAPSRLLLAPDTYPKLALQRSSKAGPNKPPARATRYARASLHSVHVSSSILLPSTVQQGGDDPWAKWVINTEGVCCKRLQQCLGFSRFKRFTNKSVRGRSLRVGSACLGPSQTKQTPPT